MAAALVLRLRVWLRSQWRRFLLVGVFVGVVGGVAMGLAAGTRRTDSAPDRYTREVGGDPDLVITQLGGAPLTARAARLPGVASARSLAFVTAFLLSPDDGTPILDPNPFAGDTDISGARIVSGRAARPGTPDEFVVNESFAALLRERYGTTIGDTFQVAAYDQSQVDSGVLGADVPLGVAPFTATLVGIARAPSDFDDPSPTMVFPPEFVQAHPDVGVVQTLIAVDVADGVDPATVMDQFHQLPNGAGAYNVPTRIVSPAARRAVQFQVSALWMVTAVACLAAAVAITIVVSRSFRPAATERSSLAAIGWRQRDTLLEHVLEGAVIAALGAIVAVLLATALTAAFPLGVLRGFEPHTGMRADLRVNLLGMLVVLAVTVIAAAHGSRRGVEGLRARPPLGATSRLAPVGSGVSLTTGAMMAVTGPTGGRRSIGGVFFGAIAVAGVVGSVIVGSSVARIVERPARWGVNYDQLYGNPYAPAPSDIVEPALDEPLITAVSGATIGSITLDGRDTSLFAFDAVRGGLDPTILEGRVPAAEDEIALGAEVADRLHAHIGDELRATGPDGATALLRVVGIAVTPDSAGNGAAMTFAGYVALAPSATENLLLVDFAADAPADVAQRVAAAAAGPGLLTKPTSVRALERVTTAPFMLAAVLTGLLVLTCAYALAMSVRARRSELAVLRALGADGRQLRGIVHWQATLLAAAVVVVGIPAGIAAGRAVVRLVTSTLGIVPGAQLSPAMLAGIAVAAILAANLLALLPARRAARTAVGELMRDR